MESGVHGVESEAAVCPGRRISGVSGSRWTSCAAGTGARDTFEGVAGITIPPEQPQSLPKALLRHPTVRYRARRPPRRSPGLAHFVIPRPGLRQTPRARHMPAALSFAVWRRAWQRLRRGLHAPGGLAEHALPALSVLTGPCPYQRLARYGTQGPGRHRRATCRLPITSSSVFQRTIAAPGPVDRSRMPSPESLSTPGGCRVLIRFL